GATQFCPCAQLRRGVGRDAITCLDRSSSVGLAAHLFGQFRTMQASIAINNVRIRMVPSGVRDANAVELDRKRRAAKGWDIEPKGPPCRGPPGRAHFAAPRNFEMR